jgi:hypothetical protein
MLDKQAIGTLSKVSTGSLGVFRGSEAAKLRCTRPHDHRDGRRASRAPRWPRSRPVPSSSRSTATTHTPDPLPATRASLARWPVSCSTRAGVDAARHSPATMRRSQQHGCRNTHSVACLTTAVAVTIYGVCAVTFMMVMYALESRGRRFVLGFAVGCVLSSVYGFVSGAWPFGVVELIWCGVALRRWR